MYLIGDSLILVNCDFPAVLFDKCDFHCDVFSYRNRLTLVGSEFSAVSVLHSSIPVLMFCYVYILFQEKKRNSLKDFLNVAGPMGVTHFLILSKTATAPYLRVGRTPQGPTLTFKINEYSLAVDVAQSQLRPRCPQDLFQNPPLVILYSHF